MPRTSERYELLYTRYVVRVMRDGLPHDDENELEEIVQRAVQDAENAISDALPEGYYCKIEEY